MRRLIDMSLRVTPNDGRNPFYGEQPIDCLHLEESRPERSRGEIFAFLKYDAFAFSDRPDEIITNIICTTDPFPGTHVETYFPEKWWYPDQKERRHFCRDVSRISVSRLVGEAVIVDFPYPEFKAIDAEHLEKTKNLDIRPGDIVFFRTGFSERYSGEYPNQGKYDASPGLTNAAAEWLAKRKIAGFGIDGRGLEAERLKNPGATLDVHRIFHLNNVTLFEDLANLKQLRAGRVFVICGNPLRIEHLTGAPGRVIAIQDGEVIDLSHGLKPYPVVESGERVRVEPAEERSRLLRRALVTPFTITDFGIDDSVGPQYIEFPSSLGTNLRVPASEKMDLEKFPVSRLVGTARIINCSHVGPGESIRTQDLEKGYGESQAEMVVLLTGHTDRYYSSQDYYDRSPILEKDCVEWLVAKGVKLLGTDAADIDAGSLSGNSQQRTSKMLSDRGIILVQGMVNGWLCLKHEVRLACLPLPFRGVYSSPAYVVAIEDW